MDEKEAVNHPSHYGGKIECIDAIESAVDRCTGFEGFCIGNAIKYLWRWTEKGGAQDLEKAVWYIQRVLKDVNGEKLSEIYESCARSLFNNDFVDAYLEGMAVLLPYKIGGNYYTLGKRPCFGCKYNDGVSEDFPSCTKPESAKCPQKVYEQTCGGYIIDKSGLSAPGIWTNDGIFEPEKETAFLTKEYAEKAIAVMEAKNDN